MMFEHTICSSSLHAESSKVCASVECPRHHLCDTAGAAVIVYLDALRWTISILWLTVSVNDAQVVEAYSTIDRTNVL